MNVCGNVVFIRINIILNRNIINISMYLTSCLSAAYKLTEFMCVCVCVCVYIYIYIYIYVCVCVCGVC